MKEANLFNVQCSVSNVKTSREKATWEKKFLFAGGKINNSIADLRLPNVRTTWRVKYTNVSYSRCQYFKDTLNILCDNICLTVM